jgi:hypothetical protein
MADLERETSEVMQEPKKRREPEDSDTAEAQQVPFLFYADNVIHLVFQSQLAMICA